MKPDSNPHRPALLASLITGVLVLSACGGGGSTDADPNAAAGVPESNVAAVSAAEANSQVAQVAQVASAMPELSGFNAKINAVQGVTKSNLIGTAAIQPYIDSNSAGMAEAFLFDAAASGTANSLNLFIDATSSATRVIVGVYADAAGKPGALLVNAALDSPVSGSWNAFALSPVQITAGARYWIAVLAPVGAGDVRFRDLPSGGGKTVTTSRSNLSAMPASWEIGRAHV